MYRIDIETDSTIAVDEAEEQRRRTEFVTAVTGFIQQAAPAVQGGAMSMDVAKALLMFGVRSFRTGRELEEAIDNMEPEQRQPDPMAVEAAQADTGLKKAQAFKAMAEAQKIHGEAQMPQQDAQPAVDPRITMAEQALKEKELFIKDKSLDVEAAKVRNEGMIHMESALAQSPEYIARLDSASQAAQQIGQQLPALAQGLNAEIESKLQRVSGEQMQGFTAVVDAVEQMSQRMAEAVSGALNQQAQMIGGLAQAQQATAQQIAALAEAQQDTAKKITAKRNIKLTFGPDKKPNGAVSEHEMGA
jgi:hypothetical protein